MAAILLPPEYLKKLSFTEPSLVDFLKTVSQNHAMALLPNGFGKACRITAQPLRSDYSGVCSHATGERPYSPNPQSALFHLQKENLYFYNKINVLQLTFPPNRFSSDGMLVLCCPHRSMGCGCGTCSDSLSTLCSSRLSCLLKYKYLH